MEEPMKTELPPNTEKNYVYTEAIILIKGAGNIQNQLFSDFITKETGYLTICQENISRQVLKENSRYENIIVFYDCMGKNRHAIWEEIGLNQQFKDFDAMLVLFNVNPDYNGDIESESLQRGIIGVFYENSPIESLSKGVRSIVKGELWFSRQTLSHFLKQRLDAKPIQYEPPVKLTPREKEILGYLVAGLSNVDIAEKLNLSLHTIKTHVYNLYKKIEVPSRLQAVLWAAQNLPYD